MAVLARALFLAMNSSRCRRLASTVALVRSSRSRCSCWFTRKASILPEYIVSVPRVRSSVCVQVA